MVNNPNLGILLSMFTLKYTSTSRRNVLYFFIAIIWLGSLQNTFAHSFNSKRQKSYPSPISTVAVGDFNLDGVPDLVTGRYPDSNINLGIVSVLFGKGNGNFQPEVKYNVGYNQNDFVAPAIRKVAVTDVNNDSWQDVIVIHNSSNSGYGLSRSLLTVLLNRGDGSLQPAESYIFAFHQSEVIRAEDFVIGDFNNDEKPDIVVICNQSGAEGLLYPVENIGNGKFAVRGSHNLGTYLFRAGTGYFNENSKLDLVIATIDGVLFLFGDGSLKFTSFTQRESNLPTLGIVSADFNNDGLVDVASVSRTTSSIRVYLKQNGGFPETPIVRFLGEGVFDHAESGDFNSDGKIDLVCANHANNTLGIIYGNGNGTFQDPIWLVAGKANSDFDSADFNLDGKIDIAASNLIAPPNEQLNIFLNAPNNQRYYGDFDGDLRTDVSVFRPAEGNWYILKSNNHTLFAHNFGISNDKLIPGNYDDDEKSDIAVFREGVWYIWQSSTQTMKVEFWGKADDIPTPGDYDNDGIMNFAVYRPSNGIWYIKFGNNSFKALRWGIDTDKPVPGDYDGDGYTDIAVYRPSNGTSYILNSSNSQLQYNISGLKDGKPVPGDYDGDGKTDVAVFYSIGIHGFWYISFSSINQKKSEQFGLATDLPVIGDFTGDSKNDLAVFRPSTGHWYIKNSRTTDMRTLNWGMADDVPIPSNYR